MFAIVLAAVSALVWGSADYCGGRATRRANALDRDGGVPAARPARARRSAWCCCPARPAPATCCWAPAAGAAGLLGIVLLYRGLSTGAMAVVAPITAVTGALLPVLVGLATEQLPSALGLVGAVCAVVAIGLVSLAGPSTAASRGHPHGRSLAGGRHRVRAVLRAGRADRRPSSGCGRWPRPGLTSLILGLAVLLVVARRGGSLRAAAASARVGRAGRRRRPRRERALPARGPGRAAVIVVAPIAALYPVSTVLLARPWTRNGCAPSRWPVSAWPRPRWS